MFAVARHMHIASICIHNFIVESECTTFHFRDPTVDSQTLPEPRRFAVAGINLGNGEIQATSLKGGVVTASLSRIIDTSFLEIDNVTRMMHNAHRVSFSVPDIEGGLGNKAIRWGQIAFSMTAVCEFHDQYNNGLKIGYSWLWTLGDAVSICYNQ
jgi:hypothetical protein